jgi:Fe-S-cluster containining protein
VDDDPPSPVECDRCGACCHQREGTILVTDDDVERWRRQGRTDLIEKLTEGHFGLRAFAMTAAGACVHLGLPGAPNDCSVHEHRATVCREFRAGCRQCREFRRERGLPATIAPPPARKSG